MVSAVQKWLGNPFGQKYCFGGKKCYLDRGVRLPRTVIVIEGLLKNTRLRGRDPQRHPGVFQSEAKQLLRPVTHLLFSFRVNKTRK